MSIDAPSAGRAGPAGSSTGTRALVALAGVRKHYGAHAVLRGVDLEVAAGQVIALVGRSGSGKSSLLRAINGLMPIDGGSIRVGDLCLTAGAPSLALLHDLRREVGMVFQKFNLFPHLSALDNVMLAPRMVQSLPQRQAAELARVMLARVGLAERTGAFPHQLSGGQQQRVAIARALALRPRVLLCDEITSALDPELTAEVLAVIRGLAEEGMTLLMATHEMAFAREVADTLVFLQDGVIHETGPARTHLAQPATPELARFLGA